MKRSGKMKMLSAIMAAAMVLGTMPAAVTMAAAEEEDAEALSKEEMDLGEVQVYDADPVDEIPIDADYFPDEVFREKVVRGFDTDEDGLLSQNEIDAVDTIKYWGTSGSQMTSLAGIEYFTNLTTLDCYSNQIQELDLTNNPALTYLDCNNNYLTELDVSANPNLLYLDCCSNSLETLNLEENKGLEELYCYNNTITELDLSDMTALTIVNCETNNLSSLDVSDCTSLVTLYCGQNFGITSMDVSGLDQLDWLSCYYGYIDELILDGADSLRVLQCGSNELQELDLSQCTKLETLDCSDNQLQDLDLRALENLESLNCTNNYDLGSLDLSHNPQLWRLNCINNNLTELDLSNNPELWNLSCDGNYLTQLDLSNNTDLYTLSCTYNCLTELDLSDLDNLQNVDLTWQDREVTALASDDKLAVSLEGLVSSDHIGNITPIDPSVTIEDNYLVIPDITAGVAEYNYTTPFGDMDVHLFIEDTTQINISSCSVTLSPQSCTYDGKAQTPEVTVTYKDRTLTEGIDYTLSYRDNTDVGTAAVIITGMGFYTGETRKTFQIEQAAIKDAATVRVTSTDMIYDGSKQTASIEVTAADGTALTEGIDYVLNGQTAKAAGTYTATITGTGSYCGTTTVKYTIAKDDQKLTVKVKKTGTKKFTIKASKLKKDARTFKLKVSKKGKMKVRYSCKNSKIKVDKNGKVTLKKGLEAGTYKIKVTTGASKNYKANKTPKYITVKVK